MEGREQVCVALKRHRHSHSTSRTEIAALRMRERTSRPTDSMQPDPAQVSSSIVFDATVNPSRFAE
jgi:hypothetical protein